MIHPYYSSTEWNKIRIMRLEKDKFKCQHCFCKATEVHHIHYRNWKKEKLEDLLSLCRNCHEKEHKRINDEIIDEIAFDEWWQESQAIAWEKIMND